jgi:hypothetical protein
MSFNIVVVAQAGRLQYEAGLFLASLRAKSPNFKGRVFIAEPQDGPRWEKKPQINDAALRDMLIDLDAEILPFENKHFGEYYPYGNKIEMLMSLPKGEPFVFFDTDTLILDDITQVPFDFDRPSASLKVEGTWPKIELYGPGYTEIWKSVYDLCGVEFESSLDLTQPDEYWRRYSYFNAGYFYYKCPHEFGRRFLEFALKIRDTGTRATECQTFDPWLDQVALPIVIHDLGGGRDTLPVGYLDGETTCHYRLLPLLYARESDKVVEVLEEVTAPNKIKKVLKGYDPFKRMIFQGRGQKVRALFDQDNLPRKEQGIRNKIKSEGFWMR